MVAHVVELGQCDCESTQDIVKNIVTSRQNKKKTPGVKWLPHIVAPL